MTLKVLNSHRNKISVLYKKKEMCPPSYQHNGFVVTHALGHMMHGYIFLVPMNKTAFKKLSKEHNINV